MKRFFSMLLALCLLCCCASAETLTGRTGFTVDYPADLLEIASQQDVSTLFLPKDESALGSFNLQIQATVPGLEQEDPAAYLTKMMSYYEGEHSEVTTGENSRGAATWCARYMVGDSVAWDWVIQQEGREFLVMTYMLDCEEAYLPVVQAMVDSFAVDLNGDMSGFDDAEVNDIDFFGELFSRYDSVLRLYGTASYEEWDIDQLDTNGISLLMVNLNDPYDILLDLIDLGGNAELNDYALVIFTKNAESEGADVVGLYVQDGDNVKTVAISGERDLYSLVKDADGAYVLKEDASNSAFQSGTLYYHISADGGLQLIEGIVYDAGANADAPWYITHDTDWDVSNDTPCTEEEAAALQAAYTDATDLNIGTSLEDFMEVDMGLEPALG